ncbi:MAG: PilZ domain-containing protein [Pseudomonadota bacterium]|nr:PilZ domain-containing protein [Pseudomonadota bacterium]
MGFSDITNVTVCVEDSTELPARLVPLADEWVIRRLDAIPDAVIVEGPQPRLVLKRGGQRLEVSCRQTSQRACCFHLGRPTYMRYETRIKLGHAAPVRLTLFPASPSAVRADVLDLSLGGMGVLLPSAVLPTLAHERYPAMLRFPLGTLETCLEVRSVLPNAEANDQWRMGARFDELQTAQRNLLRDFLSGQQRMQRFTPASHPD